MEMLSDSEQKAILLSILEEADFQKSIPQTYNSLSKEEWKGFTGFISKVMSNKKTAQDFLNIDELRSFFFVNSQGEMMQHQIEFVEEQFGKDNCKIYLKESRIGNPPFIMDYRYETTHNSIHHLYHIARYCKQQSSDIENIETVVEWGGGYGNMCKVLFNYAKKLKTYVIFDLPECLALQNLYLSSVFGKEKVNFANDGSILPNKINLLSYEKFNKSSGFKGDLFLSTWALSESPKYYHSQIEELNWFNCEKLLLSFHQCGNHIPFMEESTNLGLLAKKHGAHLKNIKIIPGINIYAFR